MIVLLASTIPSAHAMLFGGPCAPFGTLDKRLTNLKKTTTVNCTINNLACMVTTGSWPTSYSVETKDYYTAQYQSNLDEILVLEAMTLEARQTTCYQGTVYNP